MEELTAKKINEVLIDQRKDSSSIFVIPNFYINNHECDLFEITQAGYEIEYETKISLSDFKADFKKSNKHILLENGQRVSKFYFVCPIDLIPLDLIPSYAGLIYVGKFQAGFDYYTTQIIKEAPKLKDKIDYKSSITFNIACRYQRELRDLENKLKEE